MENALEENRILSKPNIYEDFLGAKSAEPERTCGRIGSERQSYTKNTAKIQFRKSSDVCIILNRPQLAENIGMAMRAMANTGVKKLRLINPKCGWPNEKITLASAEKSHLIDVDIFNSMEEAISDLQVIYATSARPRNMICEIYSPKLAAQELVASGNKAGIVFGNEKFGLTNDEISMCSCAIEIPSMDFSSYNLAQSVLIMCYEILLASFEKTDLETNSPKLKTGKTSVASQDKLEYFLNHLEENLHTHHHFANAKRQTLMMQTIRNLFKRARPTSQEIQSLCGVIDSLIRR